jgi:hypothetical protein
MLRSGLFAAIAILFLGPIAPRPAFAQALPLPAIGADGMIAPLTVDQLDASEQARFAALAPGSDAARTFLYTRGFLRYCRLVVAGTLQPLQLPDLPAHENWDRQWLSPDEIKNVLDVALGRQMIAMLGPPRPSPPPIDTSLAQTHGLPGVDADGSSLPLAVDKLTSEERARFASLAPDNGDARRFLYVRGFLRYSRLVVDRQIEPLQLPDLPARENWDRRWLSADEARDVLDVALAMSLTAKMAPQPAQ